MLKTLLKLGLFLLLINPLSGIAAESEELEESNTTSAYLSIGDALVLNLSSSNRNRITFLQLKADILVKDDSAIDLIKIHIPAIRHQLIVFLSEQDAKDMKTSSKREEIRKVATLQVQELIEGLSGNKDISDVLFSSFLVQ